MKDSESEECEEQSSQLKKLQDGIKKRIILHLQSLLHRVR